MMSFKRNHNNNFGIERSFMHRHLEKISATIIAITFLMFVTILSFWIFIGYNLVTNPEGVAGFIGNFAADVIRPVADTIKE